MEKTFDCIKMKEDIQARIYEEIKDMSSSERADYFRKKSQESALWQRLANRDKVRPCIPDRQALSTLDF